MLCRDVQREWWERRNDAVGGGRFSGGVTPDADSERLRIRRVVDCRERRLADFGVDDRQWQRNVLRALDGEFIYCGV